jgi:hypothetical protein
MYVFTDRDLIYALLIFFFGELSNYRRENFLKFRKNLKFLVPPLVPGRQGDADLHLPPPLYLDIPSHGVGIVGN